jgi:tripartite-type tricarboxylate transporter receptor subunit TctC
MRDDNATMRVGWLLIIRHTAVARSPQGKDKMSPVRIIGLAGACLYAIASMSPSQLQAQEWPARPVKIVVAFAPGGSADQLGRLFAAELSTAFGQQFYVENKPGNSGSIGSAQIARAEPDGYSLLVAGSGPHLTGPAINPNIGYDPLRDFTHIAMIAADSFVLAVNPALGRPRSPPWSRWRAASR